MKVLLYDVLCVIFIGKRYEIDSIRGFVCDVNYVLNKIVLLYVRNSLSL